MTSSLYQALCLPVAALALTACLCDDRLIQGTQSPGSEIQVKVVEVNCGATASLQRNLILSALNPRDKKGRRHPTVVFAVDDTIRLPTPTDTQPVLGLQPTWISEDTLVINYDRRARVLLSASTYAVSRDTTQPDTAVTSCMKRQPNTRLKLSARWRRFWRNAQWRHLS